jgi:hypothetical protein
MDLIIGLTIGLMLGWFWHHRLADWLQEKIQNVKIVRTCKIYKLNRRINDPHN